MNCIDLEVIQIKIRKWFRRKYIFWKYNHNFDSGKLICLKNSDRSFGLTSKLIEHSVENKIPILVQTAQNRKYLINQMLEKCNEDVTYSHMTRKYFEDLVLNVKGNYKGMKIDEILVDNSCTEHDVDVWKYYHPESKIVNGFVTCKFM